MFNFITSWYKTYLSNQAAAILLLQIVVIFIIIYFFSNIFGVLIVALVLAFILERPVAFLIRHGATRTGATTVVMLTYATVVFCLGLMVVPPAVNQLNIIAKNITTAMSNSYSLPNDLKQAPATPSKPTVATKNVVPHPEVNNDNTPLIASNTENVTSIEHEEVKVTSNKRGTSTDVENEQHVDAMAESNDQQKLIATNDVSTSTDVTDKQHVDTVAESNKQQHVVAKETSDKHGIVTQEKTRDQQNLVANAEPSNTQNNEASPQDTAPAEQKPVQLGKKLSAEDRSETDVAMRWIITKLNRLKEKLPDSYKNMVSDKNIEDLIAYSKRQVKAWVSPLLTTQVAPFLMDTVSFLAYFIIVPIFSFYMLKDKDQLLELTGRIFAKQEAVRTFWQEINIKVAQYMYGKTIHVLIISFLNWLAFLLLGMDYALLLGIGVGLSVLIPYVGAIIISVPVVMVALSQFGLSSDFVWALTIYMVIQFVDGYAITPWLFSETLNLNPFAILVAIIIFGSIWGIWGVVLAIPLATFVKTIYTMWPVNQEVAKS